MDSYAVTWIHKAQRNTASFNDAFCLVTTSGKENGCVAKEGSQGLQIVSTAGISAQRWPGMIGPVVFGPHEN